MLTSGAHVAGGETGLFNVTNLVECVLHLCLSFRGLELHVSWVTGLHLRGCWQVHRIG